MGVVVLRLGHRQQRDQRITTHCALVARALGAGGMWYTGEKDPGMEEAVRRVAAVWGGRFFVRHAESWRTVLKSHKTYWSVHLTMYGVPYEQRLAALKKKRDVLLLVGGGKVAADVYQQVRENVAVTAQPHSEVAGLGILLERLGRKGRFAGGRLRVVPQGRGKKVVRGGRGDA